MISAFYILYSPNLHLEYSASEVLLHKVYHDDLNDSQKIVNDFDEAFKRQLPESRIPFIQVRDLNYIYIRLEYNLIFLVVTRRNADTMSIIFFLYNFSKLLRHYLCKPMDSSQTTNHNDKDKNVKRIKNIIFDRDVLLDNVYFIYELLDECMDIGIIQMTDYNILKEYIKIMPNIPKMHIDNKEIYESDEEEINNSNKDSSKKKKEEKDLKNIKSTHNQAIKTDAIHLEETHINSSILRASSSSINWRPKGIFYAKNEIFIDMIENCDFYYDLQENVIIRNEVNGNLHVKCYLSGMPVCTIGFNETKISKIEGGESGVERSGNQLTVEDQEDLDDQVQDGTEPDSVEKDDNYDDYTEDVDDKLNKGENNKVFGKVKKHIPFRSIQFHQCVQLDSIYHNNLLKFIPPDDTFILMSYQVEQQRQKRKLPLILIKPIYRIIKATNKLQVLVVLSTQFKKRLHGKNLKIKIPINPLLFKVIMDDDHDLKYKTESGKVSYQLDRAELVWDIDQFTGNNPSIKMMAELSVKGIENLTEEAISASLQNKVFDHRHGDHYQHYQQVKSHVNENTDDNISNSDSNSELDDNEEAKKELDQYYGVNGAKSSSIFEIEKKLKNIKSFNDIQVTFNIPMLSYSGLRLNYLKVEEEEMKYTCFPWIRYTTISEPNYDNLINHKPTNTNHIYRFKLGTNCFQME